MALYAGVSSTARKVKKMYVGVNGTARKVKKLYVGVNGVARKVFGGGIEYYGTKSLSGGRYCAGRATLGNYGIIAGGIVNVSSVNAFNTSLTRSSPEALSKGRGAIPSGVLGSYAVFVGGYITSGTNAFDAYDSSLTHTTPSQLGATRVGFGGASSGTNFVGGGGKNTSDSYQKTVWGWNTSFTRSTLTQLNYTGNYRAGCIDGKIVFIGGSGTTAQRYIHIYDSSLTYSYKKYGDNSIDFNNTNTIETNPGNYLMFAGNTHATITNVAFDSSLTLVNITQLTNQKRYIGGATVSRCAVLAGGGSGNTYYGDVEMYDEFLTKTTLESLSIDRQGPTGVTVGNYLLFAGGYSGSYETRTDVYECNV